MTSHKPTFEVDKAGLAKLLEKRGKAFAILELLQNALDEDVREVSIDLVPAETRGRFILSVEDDDPDGFTDLAHAYTLFAESEKKGDVKKRGRFNLGEKLVIAVCESVSIFTTTGSVHFTSKGRRHGPASERRERGSLFTGELRMTKAEHDEALDVIATVLVPHGINVTFNGDVIPSRPILAEFEEVLPTEIANDEGVLRGTERKTLVSIHAIKPGETPHIYELGIPVVETDLAWHVDVWQKVPLNMDRDNVTPKYKRKLCRMVVDHMQDHLTPDEAASSWVAQALEDPDISPEAVETIITKRFGDKRVIFDPSDPEANKIAMSEGYTVIPSRTFNRDQWSNIKQHEIAKPAGRVTPSPKALDGEGMAKFVEPDKWTPILRAVAEYTEALAFKLTGHGHVIRFVSDTKVRDFQACYCRGEFTYNLQVLGTKLQRLDSKPGIKMNDLIIHELGHFYCSDHFDKAYYRALTKLGATLTQIALDDPSWFEELFDQFAETASGVQAVATP